MALLPRMVRWTLLALTVGLVALAPTPSEAAGVRVPPTVRLPSTRHGSNHYTGRGRHHRPRLRDCPTERGGSNDSNGNGVDDRCDIGKL